MAYSSMQSLNPTSSTSDHPLPRSAEEAQELQFGQVWKGAGTGPKCTSTINGADVGRRKSSVQFHTAPAEDTLRRESITGSRASVASNRASIAKSRMASPPPPSSYQRGVSFDTFSTPDAASEGYTLQYKHNDFNYTNRTRTFICGTDAKDYSEYALEWMLDELVDDGDQVVCLRVIEEKTADTRNYRQEADRLLESVMRKNSVEQKAIQMTMELAVGKVTEVIQKTIELYEPVAIVVGTRGRNLTGVQGLLPGSVSKYCLQRSPVPVIVVRPSSKRTNKKKKRQQESDRLVYSNMLSTARKIGAKNVFDKSVQDTFEANPNEREEVEKAIGFPRKGILRNKNYGGPLERVTSAASESTDEDSGTRFALPIGFLTMESAPQADLALQSPMIAALTEDWNDTPKNGSRAQSPRPGKEKEKGQGQAKDDAESAIKDDGSDEDPLFSPTIIDHRRPSTRSQVGWLNEILRQPDQPLARPQSRSRGSRSRSR